MEPTKGGYLIKDSQGNWHSQTKKPDPKKSTDDKVSRMSIEELNRDFNSATPWKPGEKK